MSMSNEQQIEDLLDKHHDSDWRLKNPTALRKSLLAALDAKDREKEESFERGRDSMRCPACGTLEACGCASPGWPFYGKDVKAQGLSVTASRQVAAPPGHILDDAGNVRRVLGTLPVTADGVVVMSNQTVYADCSNKGVIPLTVCNNSARSGTYYPEPGEDKFPYSFGPHLNECYSTKEAAASALSARAAGAGKEEA